MSDPPEVIDDPEYGPTSAAQDRIRDDGRGEKPLTLDAQAILRKLDKRSPGMARANEPIDLPSSFVGPRPIFGSSPIGSIPRGLGEGGAELDDRDTWPESDRRMGDDALAEGEGRRLEGITIRPGSATPLGGPSDFLDGSGYGATNGGLQGMSILDAGRPSFSQRSDSPALGGRGGSESSLRPVEPTPTIPIRDAFPPGLREDDSGPRNPSGVGGADQGPGGWEPSRGESSGDGMGSRHGVSAEDLLKTNELLRQLIEETKRQRVASLPAAAPRVYPGR